MKKVFTFTLIYFVLTMAWAYPWHILWFHDQYVSWGAITRDHPIMPLGISAIIIQGLVIGYLFPYYYRGGNSFKEGVKFALIIGLMVYTAMGFATAAKFKIEPVVDFLSYHTVFQTIQFVLAGLGLGVVYRESNSHGV